MSIPLFSSPSTHIPISPQSPPSSKTHLTHNLPLSLNPKRHPLLVYTKATNNGSTAVEVPVEGKGSEVTDPEPGLGVPAMGEVKFENPKWVNGTWDLTKFQKDGNTDWDAVIDAGYLCALVFISYTHNPWSLNASQWIHTTKVRRRKWLEDSPESTNNDEPMVFDTSIIPWWAWMKRFHLPEAEKLNGRAAMIGFFMAYLVDGLTGVGLVDQMGSFFCKTLLFIAVAGVLLVRKNEDIDTLKKLFDETTFYDKQWQATWQDETSGNLKKD